MGLEFIVAEEFPSIAPIKTITTVCVATAAVEAVDDKKVINEEEEEGGNCSTPKTEECILKPALVCPPAPRKPRPAKRKLGPPPHGFYSVPRDLTSVFVPVSSSRPPSKRIRAG